MANQIVVSAGAKVRNLQDVIIGTSGVLTSLGFDVANGVPRLDVNGKILVSQLPNSVMEYKGTWNISTNTPTLVNGTGNQGDVYLVEGAAVGGTAFNFGAGPITFFNGDQAIYSGSIWQRASGATGTVTSVAITESGDSLNITGSPITTSGTINIGFNGTNLQYVNGAGNLTTFPTLITSIGLSMPSAFSVANSPLTANGTIAVTGAGYASQYIRGDGTLADFPSSGGGGSSVSYYLNGGTSQGTIGGTTYYEMSKTADTGTGVDFTKSGDGFIVAFLTDANDPAQLNIPAGNWNYEIYASMSSNGGTPQMYAELYVYDGTTFTLISTSANEIIYDGTALNLYTFAMAVPATSLTLTDRLAVKIYATNSGGKTTTIHTQDGHLCQVITTFSTGITALNGLTAQVQYFQVGTSGTDFNISSTTATHTFNLPTASAANRGALSSADWTTFNGKQAALTIGNITSGNTAFLTLTGGTGAIIGSGVNINIIPSGIVGSGLTLTTTGTSGAATFIGSTLNIPNYAPDLSGYVPYSGATANVDLGSFNITASGISSFNAATLTSNLWLKNTSIYDFIISNNTSSTTNVVRAYYTTTDELRFYAKNTAGASVVPKIMVGDGTTFTQLGTGTIGGTGTANYLSKFTAASTIANSGVYDNGTNVIFGGTANTSANPTVVMQNRLGTVLSVAGFNWAGTTTDNNSINSLMVIGGYLNTSAQTVATATTAAGMQFYNGGFYWYGNSGLTIGSVYTNTQRMFLTVAGNLMINSSNSDTGFKLDVDGTGRFSGNLILKGTYADLQNTTYIRFSNSAGTTRWGYIQHDGTNMAFVNDISGGIFTFNKAATFSSSVTATNLSAYGATNTNVIIAGVNSATNNPRFFVQCEESTNTIKLIGGSSTGSDNMSLGVGGNTNIYIKAGGNVLIGTTTVNWVGSGFTLSADSGTNKWLCGPYTGAGNQFYITAAAGSGVYLASTSATSWSSLSDERYKENLFPIENAISKLSKLRPFIGNYIQDNKKTKHPFLIAQDVLQVIPEAVDVSNPEKYGLSYTDLIPILVKAIQELKAEIDTLKNK